MSMRRAPRGGDERRCCGSGATAASTSSAMLLSSAVFALLPLSPVARTVPDAHVGAAAAASAAPANDARAPQTEGPPADAARADAARRRLWRSIEKLAGERGLALAPEGRQWLGMPAPASALKGPR